jgi:hypothetical protein
MSRPLFALIFMLIVAVVFLAMWLGWRARARRDANVLTYGSAPVGAVLAEFERVLYVSTTPVGEPLVRVAAPGLRYRGNAALTVREGGVTIDIDGESPVHFSANQLRGSASAGRRVGKAVEAGGLALMRWDSGDRHLESSFRFAHYSDQLRFNAAIDQISTSTGHTAVDASATAQEDEQ